MEEVEEWDEELESQLKELFSETDESKTHLINRLNSIFAKISKGMQQLIILLPQLTEIVDHVEQKSITCAMGKMIAIASMLTQEHSLALTSLYEGRSLQEIFELSEETMDALYQLARHIYDQQHYEEASGAFCLLALINPAYTTFWHGLGNSEYCLGNYQEALLAYTFALQTDADNMTTHMLIVRTHIALGNRAQAQTALQMAAYTDRNSAFQEQLQRLKNDIIRTFL